MPLIHEYVNFTSNMCQQILAEFDRLKTLQDVVLGVESGRRQGERIIAGAAQEMATGQRLADAKELGDIKDHAGLEDDDGWETDNGSEEDDDLEDDDGSEGENDFGEESDWEDEDDSEDDDALQDLIFRIRRGCTCATARSGICKLHREYIDRYIRGPEDEMEYGSGFFPSGCGYDDLERLGYEYNYS